MKTKAKKKAKTETITVQIGDLEDDKRYRLTLEQTKLLDLVVRKWEKKRKANRKTMPLVPVVTRDEAIEVLLMLELDR